MGHRCTVSGRAAVAVKTHWGISGTERRNPACPLFGSQETLKIARISWDPRHFWLAQLLPLGEASITCFEQLGFQSC